MGELRSFRLERKLTYARPAIGPSSSVAVQVQRLTIAVALGGVHVGVAGAAAGENVEHQGLGLRTSGLETSDAEGFWKAEACTREHPHRSPSGNRPTDNASALLLQGVGSDLLDYKKRCSSVTDTRMTGAESLRASSLAPRSDQFVRAAIQNASHAGAARHCVEARVQHIPLTRERI